MKTKIELTPAQVAMLTSAEEKQLRAKFDKDLALIKNKYQYLEIDIKTPGKIERTEKMKLTDELFNQYWSEGKKVKEISKLTGYNEGYVYRIKKRLIVNENNIK